VTKQEKHDLSEENRNKHNIRGFTLVSLPITGSLQVETGTASVYISACSCAMKSDPDHMIWAMMTALQV